MALVNAEAVLLINNDQSKLGEPHGVLEQRMCAHSNMRRTARKRAQSISPGACRLPPAKPRDAYTKRLKPAAELPHMLLGEKLCRGHYGRLLTRF